MSDLPAAGIPAAVPRPPSRQTWLALALVGAAAALLGTWAANPFGQGTPATLAVGFALATALPFVTTALRSEPLNLGEPIYAASAILFLLFPFRALYLLAEPQAMAQFSARPYEAWIERSLALALGGYLLLLLGYYSRLGVKLAERLPPIRRELSTQAPIARAFVVFGIGASATLYVLVEYGRSFSSGFDDASYSSAENAVSQLSQFTLYGLVLAAIVHATRAPARTFAALAIGAMFAVTAVVSFVYVYKSALVVAIGGSALAYHFCRRRLPTAAVVGVIAVVLLVVFPLITAERRVLNERGVTSTEGILGRAEAGVTGAVADVRSGGGERYLATTLTSIASRYNGVDALALVAGYTPQLRPFGDGKEYLLLPAIAFVPRAYWPEKPRRFEEEFGQLYLGHAGNETSIGLTAFGDLYLNFGAAGVLIGALLLGIIYRLAYELLIRRSAASTLGVFVYIFTLFPLLLALESGLVPNLSQLLKQVPILAAIVVFMSVDFVRGAVPGRRL